ncbi:autotransporter assembly complex protein TamA [Psychrobacter lutiphocae]|uniref:autotransporter assembly complex protein TamA n=1 Tax=Psychrobacter lutiphocae TaxID=540500 RepID=UPI0003800C1A|nr:BamA/TamA family outer membrane protein [Psychrobacter lutiphocae]
MSSQQQPPLLVVTKLVSHKYLKSSGAPLVCAKINFKSPFRYSQLAYGLSLCLLTQVCLPALANAATNTATHASSESAQEQSKSQAQQAIEQASSVATKELQTSRQTNKSANQSATSDAALEQALIALRLKRAVEQGLIDASVLEAYQRETLNSSSRSTSDQSKSSVSNDAVDVAIKTQSSSTNTDSRLPESTLQTPNQQQSSVLADTQNNQYRHATNTDDTFNPSLDGNSKNSSDAIFERVFTDRHLDANQVGTDPEQAEVLHTAEQLDSLLAEIGSQLSVDFEQPVARLDAQQPPIGFGSQLDPAIVNPSNRQTLGIEDTDTEGTVKTDSVNQTQQVQGNISNEMAKEVQQQNGHQQAEINPEDYLPEYQPAHKGSKNQLSATQQQSMLDGIDSATDDEENVQVQTDQQESEAKPGLVKRLYNRFFNDGVSSLPRLKAKVYLNETGVALGQEQLEIALSRSDPRLVAANKGVQPITNIKAAMENIPAGSITDFSAAVPKLNQEALDAAQAVGYYDIRFSFKKIANDEIAVVIDHLGDPVKVSSRIVDIRGEGESLKEFQTIANTAPPKVGDVFNHGVYETAKHEIEATKEQFGFFDGEWLNRSVDVILPDNTADIDLIYDTGERYRFDEVVFFTIDKETGQLTTDPDKLPVKVELLHQLHEFKAGDKFAAPLVTKFTNDLSMTQYFNSVNVETIRPGVSKAVLDFEQTEAEGDDVLQNELQGITDNAEASDTQADSDGKGDISQNNGKLQTDGQQPKAGANAKGRVEDLDKLTAEAGSDNAGSTESGFDDFEEELAPLVYSVDEETTEKLAQIRAKAERLSRLPDDRVLDEVEAEAKGLLGKIANTISNTVKKVLPDEKDPLAETAFLPDDLSKTVLANRKTPQQVAETKSVPLYVFVSADKPRDVDFGIGYGTDTGVRAVTRLENNLINRDGYQAGIAVGASKINRSINLHGSRPWKHPLNDTLTGNISFEQEEINQGKGNLDLKTNTIQAGVARNIRKEDGWNQTFSLRYRLDELESGVEGPARENLPVPFDREGARFKQEALLLGYQIDRTKADNVLNPTKGWHQYYSLEAGSKNALTDTNIAIARAGVSGLYSFGEDKKHQVLASLDGGYIWADDFEAVPYKLRFFAGGDRSIRGYDYNSLSALEKGFLVGGQVLAVGSAEYNYEFKPGLRGAVFADVGNAYDKDFEAETKLGLGFGVRWASPVGMVRVDVGAGVLEDSIPIRLHFFIGSPLQ